MAGWLTGGAEGEEDGVTWRRGCESRREWGRGGWGGEDEPVCMDTKHDQAL